MYASGKINWLRPPMMNDNIQTEICDHCGVCLEVCVCLEMGRPSISSYLARGESGGAWICSNCWRCEEVCPKGLDIFSIMMGQRRVETPPPMVLEAMENIKNSGCVFHIQGLNALRKSHGLRPIKMIERKKLSCLLERG